MYISLMDSKGWTPAQIDEIDIHYFFELMAHRSKMNAPEYQRKQKWSNQKVVPIDAVF